jgi:glycosyltransferase involved in cell wall biosynthesis
MSREPLVTIGVPVYRGRAFVAETLTSIAAQRYPELTVLVSDDASDDGSAELFRPFAADPRFRLTVQPRRLGWVDHCNWLLRHSSGEFVCLVSHDDVLEPDCIARLVDCLAARADAALAFADIRIFGLLGHVEQQEGFAGTPAERVSAFVAKHFDGTAFHALVRRSAIARAGGLRGNALDNFAADVSWLGRLAYAGDFERLPEPLYRKRRHHGSVSLQWGLWDEATRAAAWSMHCRELFLDALAQPLTPVEQRAIARAVLRRLLAIEPALPFAFLRDLPAARKRELITSLTVGLDPFFAEALEELRREGGLAT